MRGQIEKEFVTVLAKAEVQNNGDGTWSAIVYLDGRPKGVATGETREKAIGIAAGLASIDTSEFDRAP